MTNQVTMTQAEYEHRLRMAHEDGYQKGLYDGIIESAQNAMPQKRLVAVGNEDGLTAVDPLFLVDQPLCDFLRERNQ